MKLEFFKYEGTGNDFVVIDNRNHIISKTNNQLIRKVCDRKFGVGADGLLLLENSVDFDFAMYYYNADGEQGSMCGNGGRSLVHFAHHLGVIDKKTKFEAVDGIHYAEIMNDDIVKLKMNDVLNIEKKENDYFLDTGSPHHIVFVNDVKKVNVKLKGAEIRYSDAYIDNGGTNVNFVQILDEDVIKIRTYERGVEEETLSCGTGAVASAIVTQIQNNVNFNKFNIDSQGGILQVEFDTTQNGFENIYLTGKVSLTFKGIIKI